MYDQDFSNLHKTLRDHLHIQMNRSRSLIIATDDKPGWYTDTSVGEKMEIPNDRLFLWSRVLLEVSKSGDFGYEL
ncbi:hypothetical protein AL480_00365 [Stenotrophomonas maltophilia]|nr:hypothetical protein AL480_00365 [Stenotrophomonas maltophilia]MBA0233857.1 hypothetical protein [Stenotrophomonas maltophilia]MBA0267797.1 hypothetical protein [Stenotrophomonas maltophilia]MBA0331990.1 hypothetical protein [Stenotrophomonas maltophilia]